MVWDSVGRGVALAVTAPVLLAEEEDHEPGKGNDWTGVWTQKLIGGSDIGDIIFLVLND